jgi:low affinity Fe/Cu permease
MRNAFQKLALATAEMVGSRWAFFIGVLVTLIWAASGPYYGYSDTWQLVINTGTTIATFLMVFLIQYTQNRDAKVMHLKLDELIRAVSAARTELVHMELMSDEQLTVLQDEFQRLQERAARGLKEIEESKKKRPAATGLSNGAQRA